MAPVAGWLSALWLLLLVDFSNGRALVSVSDHGDKVIATSDRETIAGARLLAADCKSDFDQDDLKLGLDLGSQFLVKSQREAGNFRYEYNWLTKTETDEDNPVRQAGTLWGLTLLHVDDPKRNLLPVIRKGIDYFEKHSVEFPGGKRMVNYPGQDPQKLGSVALLALATIEVLRQPDALEGDAEKQKLEGHLNGYLKAILDGRTGKGNFYKFYDGTTGKHFGPTSPYYDGECLLALVKAAKYLGLDHLWPHVKASAEAGWRKNVQQSLKLTQSEGEDASVDSNGQMKAGKKKKDANARLKGYYQWGTMAWYELLGMDDPEFSKYGTRLLDYGKWLIGRGAPSKDFNVGYAFEGIIPAYVTAVREGDELSGKKFACAIREGIANLHTLQVGHPKEFELSKSLIKHDYDNDKKKDERAKGGAQGSRDSPGLRIDTTQHQLHALLMANRLIQQQALI